MRSRDADLLFIPGLGGAGPDHWQSRWAAKLPHAVRVERGEGEPPAAAAWAARVAEAAARCERPVVAVAHGFGVAALVAAAAPLAAGGRIAGAFLVAPPGEAALADLAPAFGPYPSDPLPFRSLLVASRTDPRAEVEESATLAAAWGSDFVDAGDAGSVDPASGHGPWPEGLMTFGRFLGRL